MLMAVNFMKKLKSTTNLSNTIEHVKVTEEIKRNLSNRLKETCNSDTLQNFDTKQSNDYVSKNCCER